MNEIFRHADADLERAPARHERRLEVAGVGIRIRVAGTRMAAILDPAFNHLRVTTPAEPDDLVITLVEGPPPAGADLADYGDGALSLFDLPAGRVAQWIPDVARIPFWAATSPLRVPIGLHLAARGRFLLHGAAIGYPEGAVLVTAKGGSGKSTCALASLDAHPDLVIAGDDFVAFEPDAARVHAFLGIAKIERAALSRFPRIAGLVVDDGGPLDVPAEKAVLRLHPAIGTRFAPCLPVRAIVVPSLGLDVKETRIEPISRGQVLLALAPSSILFVRGLGGESLGALAALVEKTPVFGLRLGSDVRRIPAMLEEVLGRG
jgi:hypothetical protein